MNLHGSEQKRESSYTEEEQLIAVRQAKRFLLGLLGDRSVGAEEMEQLRQIIRDPQTPLGQRARDIHQRLERIWEAEPNAYRGHRVLFHPNTGEAPSENDVGN